MILRVPDYYDAFVCIADRCTGSCCDGWEIDIDDASRDYYSQVSGEIGDRLRDRLYRGEDGGYRFRLGEHGRCPFLNEKGLCDIYAALGEEALSEVCTDFPRFALTYGHVMQKILSVSCEEVARILFSRKSPVTFVERALPGCVEDWEDDENEAYVAFLEDVQGRAIALLQERSLPLAARIERFLGLCECAQDIINRYGLEEETRQEGLLVLPQETPVSKDRARKWKPQADAGALYAAFDNRWTILEGLEELGAEWADTKRRVRRVLTETAYSQKLSSYLASEQYDEVVYEQLLVYFAFRYLMQAVYSWDLLAHAKMIVSFALMVRDLVLLRWTENGGALPLSDQTHMAYLFSREVEHSEENFEQTQEELLFE